MTNRDPSEYAADGPIGSLQSRLNNAFPAVPETSDSLFGRRMQDLARGSKQVEEIAGGILFVAGKITVPSLADYGENFAIHAGRGVVKNSPLVGSLSKTENFGDIFEYGSEVLLESIPLFVVAMLLVLLIRKFRAW
ncbi:MAG: hypothetical protein WC003_11465 [Terrimicrobiaceae bacterium]